MGTWWIIGFVAAAAVVAIVAVLLLGILYQAQRILKLAGVAAQVVGEIDANTRSVWALKATNATAAQILGGAGAIEGNAAAIRQAVAHDQKADAA